MLARRQYQQCKLNPQEVDIGAEGGILTLSSLSDDLVLEDNVLEHVKKAWRKITTEAEDEFMKFNAREGFEADEEYQ